MEIPKPQSTPISCPRCGEEASFTIPYQMLFMSEDEWTFFEQVMRQHPHRLKLERLPDRQILWYFPDLYSGPWQGWEARFGVCVCHSCGLCQKHDYAE
jgi:hypothetical protein